MTADSERKWAEESDNTGLKKQTKIKHCKTPYVFVS